MELMERQGPLLALIRHQATALTTGGQAAYRVDLSPVSVVVHIPKCGATFSESYPIDNQSPRFTQTPFNTPNTHQPTLAARPSAIPRRTPAG